MTLNINVKFPLKNLIKNLIMFVNGVFSILYRSKVKQLISFNIAVSANSLVKN